MLVLCLRCRQASASCSTSIILWVDELDASVWRVFSVCSVSAAAQSTEEAQNKRKETHSEGCTGPIKQG